MAVDRWFIGGGAEHTPESARRLVYASTSGSEGTGGVSDLRVSPLAVPGQGVRVTIGSALIRSRYVGGETQTYMGTVYQQEEVEVTPTGSGSGRADLIVLRVEDPFAAGSTYPEPPVGDIATSPYVYVRVISGVPANTTKLQDVPGYQNDSAVTLARINLPASTGTVTAAMITDLRKVALPREITEVRSYNVTGAGEQWLTSKSPYPGGQTFPIEAETGGNLDLEIPEWATRMKYTATWSQLYSPGKRQAMGDFWIQVGATADPTNIKLTPGRWDIDETSSGHRIIFRVAHTQAVPKNMRGTTKRFYPRVNMHASVTGTNHIKADWATSFDLTVVFAEAAD